MDIFKNRVEESTHDFTYLLAIIDFIDDKDERVCYHHFFTKYDDMFNSIKLAYDIGISLKREKERKVFFQAFLYAKVDLKLNYQDALTYAKLSVLFFPYQVNSKWLEIRTYKNENPHSTPETTLARNEEIIDFAFRNRYLKGAHAWVQDLDGVKTLTDDEKPPFELTEKQASNLADFPDKILDSYTRLRRTIPELKHEIVLKAIKVNTGFKLKQN